MPPDPRGDAPSEEPQRTSDLDDFVSVGRVIAASGVRGEFKVESLSDDPSRFLPGAAVYLNGSLTTVERSSKAKWGLRLKLEAVNDRTHAESLRGASLTVSRDEVRLLPEGSYYHFQIIDIEVRTEGGEHLGRVREVLTTGANDVYVVRDRAGGELLLPALKEVVLDVNLDDNRMLVRLPEGLR